MNSDGKMGGSEAAENIIDEIIFELDFKREAGVHKWRQDRKSFQAE